MHAVGDLMFRVTDLHGGALWGFLVGHDTLMLLWGLWCLRGLADRLPDPPGVRPTDSAPVAGQS